METFSLVESGNSESRVLRETEARRRSARLDASESGYSRSKLAHLHQVSLTKLDGPDELLSVHEVRRSSFERKEIPRQFDFSTSSVVEVRRNLPESNSLHCWPPRVDISRARAVALYSRSVFERLMYLRDSFKQERGGMRRELMRSFGRSRTQNEPSEVTLRAGTSGKKRATRSTS